MPRIEYYKTKRNTIKAVYFNGGEVSKITGMCYETVRKHINAGILKTKKRPSNSKHFRIRYEDAEAYAVKAWASGRYNMLNPALFEQRANVLIRECLYML